jgi:hypothetical protein
MRAGPHDRCPTRLPNATRIADAATGSRDRMDTRAGGAPPAAAPPPQAAPTPAPAAAPAPSVPAPVAAPGGDAAATAEQERKVAQLMGLGATRSDALQFLSMANGNVDLAASLLFGGM